MIDWRNKTWQPGDQAQYCDMAIGRPPQFYPVHPGLFWYSGFGMGHFFRPDGTLLWCCRTEANIEAEKVGVSLRFVDALINISQAVSVAD